MSFDANFLEEIRNRVSLHSVVARKVKLAKRGRDYLGLCPFHNEKTPSFTVRDDKGFYHCFGCGAHGDVISFEMQANGLSFMEAIESLAKEAGLEVPKQTLESKEKTRKITDLYEVMEKACLFFEKQLEMSNGSEGLRYLKKRGLSEKIIKNFRLGYAPHGNALRKFFADENIDIKQGIDCGLILISDRDGNPFDYFRNRVMFPIMDIKGRIIAFGGRVMDDSQPKYLNSPDTALFSKGRVLYSLNKARDGIVATKNAVICEGYMDVIALHNSGISNAVAPLGTALTEEQMMLLWRFCSEPTVCFDGDEAGQRAMLRATDRALPILKVGNSLKFVTLPEGEDPDDFVKVRGKDAFLRLLEEAIPLFEVVWGKLTKERKVKTPEQKALLEQDIINETNLIKDSLVKSNYLRELKNKFFENYIKNSRTKQKAAPSFKGKGILPEQIDTRNLISLAVLYPKAALRWLERFSAIKPIDVSLIKMMPSLVEALSSLNLEEDETLEKRLIEQGFSEALSLMAVDISIYKKKFKDVSQDYIAEEIKKGLDSIEENLINKEREQLAALLSSKEEKITRDDYERFLALHNEKERLQNKDSN
ncbi:MAG: DNA primase [Alphaproteobacteria bacterium]